MWTSAALVNLKLAIQRSSSYLWRKNWENQAVDQDCTENPSSSSTIVLACVNQKSCTVAAATIFISISAPWTLVMWLKGGVTSAEAARTSYISTKESATFFKRKTRTDRNTSTFEGSTGTDMATVGRTGQDEWREKQTLKTAMQNRVYLCSEKKKNLVGQQLLLQSQGQAASGTHFLIGRHFMWTPPPHHV